LIDLLRDRQTAEAALNAVASSAQMTSEAISNKLNQTLGVFSGAVDRLSGLMEGLTKEMALTSAASAELGRKAVETAEKAHEIMQQALGLPEHISNRLDEVVSRSGEALEKTSDHFSASIAELRAVPEQFKAAMSQMYDEQRAEVVRTGEAYQRDADESRRRTLAAVDEALAKMESFLTAAVQTLGDSISRLESLPANLQSDIRRQFEEQIAQVASVGNHYESAMTRLREETVISLREVTGSFNESVALLAQMPVQLQESLRQAFQSQINQVKEVGQGYLDDLKRVEDRVYGLTENYARILNEKHLELTQKLQALVPEIVKAQVQAMQKAADQVTEDAAKIDARFETVFQEAKRRVQDAVAASLNKVTEIIENFRQGLYQVEKELPDSVRAAQREVIEKTNDCALRLTSCADELSKASRELPQALDQLTAPIRMLNLAARDVRDAADNFASIKPIVDRSLQPLRDDIGQIVVALKEPTGRTHVETWPLRFRKAWHRMTRRK